VPAQLVLHTQQRLAYIQQNLVREPSEQPKDSQGVLSHAQRHGRLVPALQFQVDEIAFSRLAEEIQAQVLDLRQFHIQPFFDRCAGQFANGEPGGPLQQQFQRDVVDLHVSHQKRNILKA
jgi:hypothetical protein